MRTRFIIDIATGTVTRTILGATVSSVTASILTARDKLECEVMLTAGGQNVTAALLGSGVKMHLGVRRFTSDGDLLGMSETYQLVGEGDQCIAQCLLDLNTKPVKDLVDSIKSSRARTTTVFFECEIEAEDERYRETLVQVPFSLQFEVLTEGDEPPAAAEESANTAKAAAEVATVKAEVATEKADIATKAAEDLEDAVSAAEQAAESAVQDRQAVEAVASQVVQKAQTVEHARAEVVEKAAATETNAANSLAGAMRAESALAQFPDVAMRVGVSEDGLPTWDGGEWPANIASISDIVGLEASLGSKLDASSPLDAAKLVGAMPIASLPAHTHAELAPLASPAFTDSPTAPTPAADDDSKRLATTAFVRAAVAALVNSAPAQLDTLGELADAIAEDRNLSASLVALIGEKLAKDANLSDLTDKAAAKTALQIAIADVIGLTGALAAKQDATTISTLAYAAAVAVDLAAGGYVQQLALTGDITISTTNRAASRERVLILSAGAAARSIAWEGWTVFGAALPTNLAAGKTLRVSLQCVGANVSDVHAGGAVSA